MNTLVVLTRRLVDSLRLTAGRIQISGDGGLLFDHTVGSPVGDATDIVLESGGREVGVLTAWPRLGEATLPGRDVKLVANAAAPLAHLAATVRLTGDLRRSQSALVNAAEEERRRVYRDLHDDLGPALAGQALLLDAAVSTFVDDPARSEGFVTLARHRTDEVIDHIRRLARDLRPAALDQLGLAASLRQAASAAGRTHLSVEARIGDLPPLPAATETAAYRIITEALTNAIRHSNGSFIRIRVEAGHGTLSATVEDDGCGGAPAEPATNGSGTGLRSMRRRAEEIGGQLRIVSIAGAGTTVELSLPAATDA